MKTTLLLLVTVATLFAGCTKEKNPGIQYPFTSLPNTTWRAYSSTNSFSGNIYIFLHFNGSQSITISFADVNGNNAVSNTYPCIITTQGNHIDSFEVDYPSGKKDIGFTTDNINEITFTGLTFTKSN